MRRMLTATLLLLLLAGCATAQKPPEAEKPQRSIPGRAAY